jgi:hypothetical protein
MIQGQSGQGVCKIPSKPTAGCSGAYLSSQALGEAEIGRIRVLGQPRQKSKNVSMEKDVLTCDCQLKIEGSWTRPAWAKKQELLSKIIRAKRAGGMVQSVEHLPCMCEALCSNSNSAKKKKKKKKKKKSFAFTLTSKNEIVELNYFMNEDRYGQTAFHVLQHFTFSYTVYPSAPVCNPPK